MLLKLEKIPSNRKSNYSSEEQNNEIGEIKRKYTDHNGNKYSNSKLQDSENDISEIQRRKQKID